MTIYNTTFMLERDLCGDFLHWLRDEAVPQLVKDSRATSPRLTTLVEVPGDPAFNEHALSYALQLEFAGIDAARSWADECLMPVIDTYTQRFGRERAVVFTTILEELDI